MRLSELQAQFLRRVDDTCFSYVQTAGEADGIIFLCPVCFERNKGPIGTHSIILWRPRVPQTTHPTPGRWEFQGSSLGDLTLVAGSSSVQLLAPCNAHFFVRCGSTVLV